MKIKHNRINTAGLVHLTWRAEIYAREALVEVSCMRNWFRSTIFLKFYLHRAIWNVVTEFASLHAAVYF